MTENLPPDLRIRPSIFGTDGVRDVAGQGRLAPAQVQRLGGALARFAAARFAAEGTAGPVRIVLARDPRPSGSEITAQLAGAMRAQGAEVFDGGVLPSPALAWLTASGGYALGCAISASHNPADYNGIKPFLGDARKLSQAEECEVESLLGLVDPGTPATSLPRATGAAAAYVRAAVGELARGGDLRGLKLVVDLSAGAASSTAPEALAQLGIDATLLHAAGSRAINDDCGTESPRAWLQAVRESGADGGLAFDGDADRVFIADETGALLDGDDLLAILAADLAAHGGVPAQTVVSTVMANLGLKEFLDGHDITLERTPVGDRHVAERMRTLGAVLGGEPAGHIVLPRADLCPGGAAAGAAGSAAGSAAGRAAATNGSAGSASATNGDTGIGSEGLVGAGLVGAGLVGDGLFAGIRVLQAARRSGRSLSQLRALRARRPQLNVNVRMEERRDLAAWDELQSQITRQEAALGPGGRFVVRYSGTEPLLRVMAEGRDEKAVNRAVEAVADVARGTGP